MSLCRKSTLLLYGHLILHRSCCLRTVQRSRAAQYHRRTDHVPNTQTKEETHYVLALKTDQKHHDTMTALRDQFFPPHLNKLAAHVALFRALPGSMLDAIIIPDLRKLSSTTQPFPLRAAQVFRLSKGVAIHVDDDQKSQVLYETLRNGWHGFLSQQDQSDPRPHYTIANKLGGEDHVRRCLESVIADFHGSEGIVEGLALYRYDRGWWKDEKVFGFGQDPAANAKVG